MGFPDLDDVQRKMCNGRGRRLGDVQPAAEVADAMADDADDAADDAAEVADEDSEEPVVLAPALDAHEAVSGTVTPTLDSRARKVSVYETGTWRLIMTDVPRANSSRKLGRR